jgi:hypothetical protein
MEVSILGARKLAWVKILALADKKRTTPFIFSVWSVWDNAAGQIAV